MSSLVRNNSVVIEENLENETKEIFSLNVIFLTMKRNCKAHSLGYSQSIGRPISLCHKNEMNRLYLQVLVKTLTSIENVHVHKIKCNVALHQVVLTFIRPSNRMNFSIEEIRISMNSEHFFYFQVFHRFILRIYSK
jgi:hypothetical protein